MKTCPVCQAVAFDDSTVCYGCMHRYDDLEPEIDFESLDDGEVVVPFACEAAEPSAGTADQKAGCAEPVQPGIQAQQVQQVAQVSQVPTELQQVRQGQQMRDQEPLEQLRELLVGEILQLLVDLDVRIKQLVSLVGER